jgi:uncharacterized coiled-coil DUF342 family protein
VDITPYIGTIVTVIIAVGSVYAAISSRLARLETMIETLTTTVNKHNNVIERTFKLETEITNIYHRIDDLKEEVKHE